MILVTEGNKRIRTRHGCERYAIFVVPILNRLVHMGKCLLLISGAENNAWIAGDRLGSRELTFSR